MAGGSSAGALGVSNALADIKRHKNCVAHLRRRPMIGWLFTAQEKKTTTKHSTIYYLTNLNGLECFLNLFLPIARVACVSSTTRRTILPPFCTTAASAFRRAPQASATSDSTFVVFFWSPLLWLSGRETTEFRLCLPPTSASRLTSESTSRRPREPNRYGVWRYEHVV